MFEATILLVSGYLVGACSVGVFMVALAIMAKVRVVDAGRLAGQFEQELHRKNQELEALRAERKAKK